MQTQKWFTNRPDLNLSLQRIEWTAERLQEAPAVSTGKSQEAWTAVEVWPAELAKMACSEGEYEPENGLDNQGERCAPKNTMPLQGTGAYS